MVATIFRVVIIIFIILVVIAIIGSVSVSYSLSISSYVGTLTSIMEIVCYIIPFNKLMPIFTVVVALVCFKISVTLVKTLWNLFPLRG